MKISEAILYILRESGGENRATQFDAWLGQLRKSGYVEVCLQGAEGERMPGYVITEKGKQLLRGRGV